MDEPSSITGLFYYQGDFRRLEVEISEGKISNISKASIKSHVLSVRFISDVKRPSSGFFILGHLIVKSA